MYEKLKSFIANDAVFTAILLVLVGIISFGLGRQSTMESSNNLPNNHAAGIIFTEPTNTQVTSVERNSVTNTQVVGSRSGTKYHLLDCPGAAQMKEENKVFFDSIELAKAAGYTPAANCPGLRD